MFYDEHSLSLSKFEESFFSGWHQLYLYIKWFGNQLTIMTVPIYVWCPYTSTRTKLRCSVLYVNYFFNTIQAEDYFEWNRTCNQGTQWQGKEQGCELVMLNCRDPDTFFVYIYHHGTDFAKSRGSCPTNGFASKKNWAIWTRHGRPK